MMILEQRVDSAHSRITANGRVLENVRERAGRSAQNISHMKKAWRPMLYGGKDHLGLPAIERELANNRRLLWAIILGIVALFLK